MGKKKKPTQKKGSNSKKAEKAAQKSVEKKKMKIAKDMTFGLKNKKKSKRVQKFVQGVKRNAVAMKKQRELSASEKKKLRKLEEKARERELKRYFGDSAYTEKKKNQSVNEVMNEVDEEMKDEKELTIEEVIEVERYKIENGTPVTEETFKKWKEFRMKMKRTKEKRMEKMKDVMTGKEIFMKSQSKFVDDEDAEDAENLKIDDDLFLGDFDELIEDAEEEESVSMDEFLKEFTDESSYVPMLWKGVESKKTPKSYLFDLLREKNEGQAIFLNHESDGQGGYMIRCVFEFRGEKREIVNKAFVKKKKMAEHTASILAIKFIRSLGE